MTNADLTEIVAIIDRSGYMATKGGAQTAFAAMNVGMTNARSGVLSTCDSYFAGTELEDSKA
jgi:hypothetical protein